MASHERSANINKSADLMLNKLQAIMNDKMRRQPTYSGAIVESLNQDNTVNVYIPPNKTVVFTRISNQTAFPLAIGDSVELLLRDGSYNNCWIVAKHGASYNETINDDGNQEVNSAGETVKGVSTLSANGGGTPIPIMATPAFSTAQFPSGDYITMAQLKEILENYVKKEDLLDPK